MIEWVQQTEGIWQYIALFLIAMVPLVDIFFVVSVGIAFRLSPVIVGIIGFAGNYLMVLLLGLFFRQVAEWQEKRRIKKGITKPSKKETRARRIWERYGLPGLALFSWMGVSLILWTIVLTIGSVYGFSYMDWV